MNKKAANKKVPDKKTADKSARKQKYKQLFIAFILVNVIPLLYSMLQPGYDPKPFLAIFNVLISFVIVYYIFKDIKSKW
ncbi:MAG: hypothetical protein AB1420_02790 [Bacillota bacterium]